MEILRDMALGTVRVMAVHLAAMAEMAAQTMAMAAEAVREVMPVTAETAALILPTILEYLRVQAARVEAAVLALAAAVAVL